jgi:hypothetical protein
MTPALLNMIATASLVLFITSAVTAALLLLLVDIVRTAIKGAWFKLTFQIMVWNVAVVIAAIVYFATPFLGLAFLRGLLGA